MRRVLLGLALVLHGLAHANAGMLAANDGGAGPTVLWAVASVSFLAAGCGLLGVRRLGPHWQATCLAGIGSSILMLLIYRPATAIAGIAVDLVLIGILGFVAIPRREWTRPRPGPWAAIGRTMVFATLAYVAVVIVVRPWHQHWGSSDAELRATLPGDDLVPNAHYTIQHAVTIRATPDAIWPWLVQLGQDRGGFYSYAWLERLVGDDIHNADRIHPEWQTLHEGDLVRAVQPDYLGGIFGPSVGWYITRLEPNRVLVLGGWGAFVLEPVGDSTRLIVRSRGANEPNVALAPFGLLVFEPAHFIMQRRMLLGIRERAERASWRSGRPLAVGPDLSRRADRAARPATA
jgi:hypothetical protein